MIKHRYCTYSFFYNFSRKRACQIRGVVATGETEPHHFSFLKSGPALQFHPATKYKIYIASLLIKINCYIRKRNT
jgi:hypothetical protein